MRTFELIACLLQLVLRVLKEPLEGWLGVALGLLRLLADVTQLERQQTSCDACQLAFFVNFCEDVIQVEVVDGRLLFLALPLRC